MLTHNNSHKATSAPRQRPTPAPCSSCQPPPPQPHADGHFGPVSTSAVSPSSLSPDAHPFLLLGCSKSQRWADDSPSSSGGSPHFPPRPSYKEALITTMMLPQSVPMQPWDVAAPRIVLLRDSALHIVEDQAQPRWLAGGEATLVMHGSCRGASLASLSSLGGSPRPVFQLSLHLASRCWLSPSPPHPLFLVPCVRPMLLRMPKQVQRPRFELLPREANDGVQTGAHQPQSGSSVLLEATTSSDTSMEPSGERHHLWHRCCRTGCQDFVSTAPHRTDVGSDVEPYAPLVDVEAPFGPLGL